MLQTDNNIKYFLKDNIDLSNGLKEIIESPIFNNLIVNQEGTVFAIQLDLDESYDFGNAVQNIRSTLNSWGRCIFSWSSYDS